ncbi:hypothetical protein ACFLZ7_03060 [Nanoarchaeota archaeon]
MNKKAQLFHWSDVAWSILVSLAILLLFFNFTQSREIETKKLIDDTDLRLEQETVLINYLRMPVSETEYAKSGEGSGEHKVLIDYAVQNQLTIADLFGLPDSFTLISRITKQEMDQEQGLPDVEIYVTHPDAPDKFRREVIRPLGQCIGETSAAYIPVKNKEPIAVYLKLCR